MIYHPCSTPFFLFRSFFFQSYIFIENQNQLIFNYDQIIGKKNIKLKKHKRINRKTLYNEKCAHTHVYCQSPLFLIINKIKNNYNKL